MLPSTVPCQSVVPELNANKWTPSSAVTTIVPLPAATARLVVGTFPVASKVAAHSTVENVPHSLGVAAAVLDLALLVALAGLARRAGSRPLRELWQRAGRA